MSCNNLKDARTVLHLLPSRSCSQLLKAKKTLWEDKLGRPEEDSYREAWWDLAQRTDLHRSSRPVTLKKYIHMGLIMASNITHRRRHNRSQEGRVLRHLQLKCLATPARLTHQISSTWVDRTCKTTSTTKYPSTRWARLRTFLGRSE